MSNLKFSVRSSLFLGAATAAALSLSPSFAQQQAETVVVTGSRIPQQGIVSASPVTMVSQEDVQLQGTTDVGTLLNNLPSVLAAQTAGEGNGSSGTVTVDLRALGASRTLVLVDGKRLGPGDAELPYADLNQIPSALVDHVEVLTGGASAVYGSDAVAGVVNFIMAKDYEGIKIDATISAYQHDNSNSQARALQDKAGFAKAPDSVFDGSHYDFNFVVGTNTANNKGNITAYLGYQRQNQVLQKARDFSACSVSNAKGSGSTSYNTLKCAGSSNYDLFYSFTGPQANADYFFMQPGGNLVSYSGASDETFNYGAYNSLIRPQTRWTGGAFAHYEVDKMLDVYANFMFMDNHNSWQAAPTGSFFGQGPSGDISGGGALFVSCNNPLLTSQFISYFCPGGTASAQNAELYVGRRNVEGGGRVTDFRHTSYRIVLGAKGDLGDDWTYDISAQESLTLYGQLYLHDWSKAAVQNSLLYNPKTGTCVSGTCLDIFHGIGGITTAMEDAIYTHGQRTGYTEEQVLEASIAGDLTKYGVKSPYASTGMGVAFGADYRKDILEETTSMADQGGDLFGAGAAAMGQPRASIHVWELYGEGTIPLVQGVDFIQDLSANVAYRYSEYSPAGATRSYKYGLEWKPIDDLKFRASANRAVRAPNVLELYNPQVVALGSYEDPCATSTPSASLAGCMASGVTAAQYGHILQCPASQCNYLSGGNTALKPEIGDTKTLGVVFTPTFLPGFQATVDYFNIYVKNYVGTVPQTVAIAECTSLANTAMCSLIHRGVAGNLFSTDGYVVGTNINTGYLKEDGVDIDAVYQAALSDFGIGDYGAMSVHLLGTYTNSYKTQPYTGANTQGYTYYDCDGLYGQTCGSPTYSWRHALRTTWSTPWNFDFSLNWRHMSGVKIDGNDSNPFIHQSYVIAKSGGGAIPSYDYLDVASVINVNEHVQLSVGINNVFDKDPPLLASGGKTVGPTGPLNGNTFNGIYDSLGRYMFMNIVIKS